MPVKHIPSGIWREVEKELVKAVVETQKPVKESEIIELLLRIGIKNVQKKDYQSLKDEKS